MFIKYTDFIYIILKRLNMLNLTEEIIDYLVQQRLELTYNYQNY